MQKEQDSIMNNRVLHTMDHSDVDPSQEGDVSEVSPRDEIVWMI